MYSTSPMQSFRIRHSIMKETPFTGSWQMLNHWDLTVLSLLQESGKGQFLVSSIALVATSYLKNVHCYTRKKKSLLISIFMALPQSPNNSNLQHSHILTVFPVFFPLHNFIQSNKLTFVYLKGKLTASKL